MGFGEIELALDSDGTLLGLRASLALRRIEANQVAPARRRGCSWQQIGDALAITRQSVRA